MSSTQQSSSGVGNTKGKKTDRNRRTWTQRKEITLISALKDLIDKGQKSDNGFRGGYLNKLEAAMNKAFLGTDLKAMPHINSKLSNWKKSYNSLTGILNRSGVGWNLRGDHMFECEDEQWEQIVKMDPNARVMRHKMFPYYDDWKEIFGKDRATGEHAEDIQDAWNDLNGKDQPMPDGSATGDHEVSFENELNEGVGDRASQSAKDQEHSSKSGKKRKVNFVELGGICELLSEMNRSTNARLEQLANRMGYEFDMGKARQEINQQLKEIPGMSRANRFIILELVAFKAERLEIWKGRADYVDHLLMNRDT